MTVVIPVIMILLCCLVSSSWEWTNNRSITYCCPTMSTITTTSTKRVQHRFYRFIHVRRYTCSYTHTHTHNHLYTSTKELTCLWIPHSAKYSQEMSVSPPPPPFTLPSSPYLNYFQTSQSTCKHSQMHTHSWFKKNKKIPVLCLPVLLLIFKPGKSVGCDCDAGLMWAYEWVTTYKKIGLKDLNKINQEQISWFSCIYWLESMGETALC